jgi:hypothetical protein
LIRAKYGDLGQADVEAAGFDGGDGAGASTRFVPARTTPVTQTAVKIRIMRE